MRSMIQIHVEQCIHCGACVRDCPVKILKPGADGVPFVSPELERFCLNCQHCLAICPVGAVACNGVFPEQCAPNGPLPEPDAMFHLLRQRRSIRAYKDENLDPVTLGKLKDSLAWSPTGCNDHSLFFSIVEDKAQMEFFRVETSRILKFLVRTGILRLVYPNYKQFLSAIMTGEDVIFRHAPHMIVAAVPKSAPCREADPWIALSYFDLFAQSLGVGTCWCGFAVHAFRFRRVLRRKLNLPPGYRVGAVLLFGRPAVSYARATAPAPWRTGK